MVTTQLIGSPSYPPYVSSAAWLAYAPWDKSFYVASPPSSVDVVLASNQTVAAVIPVGQNPFGVAVDNATQQVFVTDAGSDAVSVIAGSTQNVTQTISVQSRPAGVAFDPSTGELFVADNGSANVSVISVSSLKVIATLAVGRGPIGVAWDPSHGSVFVADSLDDKVSVLSASPLSTVANVSVGRTPYDIAVDNATATAFVTNSGSYNLSVISTSTDRVVATIPLVNSVGYQLQGIAYDPFDGMVWVAGGLFVVIVLDPANNSVAGFVYNDPNGVGIDSDTGEICFTNADNATFICMGPPGGFNTKAVALNFIETGLASGTAWTVGLRYSGTSLPLVNESSNTTVITFWVAAGFIWELRYNYSFEVATLAGYAAFPASGYAANATGIGQNVSVVFYSGQVTYVAQFQESGLPAQANWNVSAGGRTAVGAGLTHNLTGLWNGSYTFRVAASGYLASPATGPLVIGGRNVSISISFQPYVPGRYRVDFNETGLPARTNWSVILGGASLAGPNATHAFQGVLNGSYTFTVGPVAGWSAAPADGQLNVNGQNRTVAVAWSRDVGAGGAYRILFQEFGLPNGTLWNVTVNGSANSATTSKVVFSAGNGTYPWAADAFANGTAVNATGSVTISGKNQTINVTFLVPAPAWSVTLRPAGLPAGLAWSVTITVTSGGTFFELTASLTRSASAPSTVEFRLSNGTYRYVASAAGYNSPAGVVSVAGSTPSTITLSFVGSTGGPGTGSALPLGGLASGVGIGLLAIGVIGVAALGWRERERRRDQGQALVRRMLSEASSIGEAELADPTGPSPPRP